MRITPPTDVANQQPMFFIIRMNRSIFMSRWRDEFAEIDRFKVLDKGTFAQMNTRLAAMRGTEYMKQIERR